MTWHDINGIRLFHGDTIAGLREMPEQSVHCCVTSPPYFGLRDYGVAGQHGLEETPEAYVATMVEVFREVRRVLRDDGTLWLNIGDSYASKGGRGEQMGQMAGRKHGAAARGARIVCGDLKQKDLIGIPWMLAFALRADGWYLRQDIIWHKKNPMPESVRDRCTKSHEYLFLLSKSDRYYYDQESIKEDAAPASMARWAQDVAAQNGSDRVPGKTNGTMKAVGGPRKRNDRFGGNKHNADTTKHSDGSIFTGSEVRNKRSVWVVTTQPFSGAHFATFPPALIAPCIMAGAPVGGVVLDPYMGSGTTAVTAYELGREAIGCELNGEYLHDIAIPRIKQATKQQRLIA